MFIYMTWNETKLKTVSSISAGTISRYQYSERMENWS